MNHTKFRVSKFENQSGTKSWRVVGQLHGVQIRKCFKTRKEAATEQAALELKAAKIASDQRALYTTLTEDQTREAECLFRRVADKPHPLSFYVEFALANYWPTTQEAAAERAALELKAVQIASGLRPLVTVLTGDQAREAEWLFHRVADKPHPLSFYVEFGVANYRQATPMSLTAAVTEYVAAKQRAMTRDHLSEQKVARIRYDLKRLDMHFAAIMMTELTLPKLLAYLEHDRPAVKKCNTRWGIVLPFLRYAFNRGWIAENLMKVPHHGMRHRHQSFVKEGSDRANHNRADARFVGRHCGVIGRQRSLQALDAETKPVLRTFDNKAEIFPSKNHLLATEHEG